MSSDLDPALAAEIVGSARSGLGLSSGSRMVCLRRALDAALLRVAHEAFAAGFLAGQEARCRDHVVAGSPMRPSWMDLRIDDPALRSRSHPSHLRPIVVRSLADAGYARLGDLRWVGARQLCGLHYVGIKTAHAIVRMVRQAEDEGDKNAVR